MRVHIDADVLVYRAGFAAEHTIWTITNAKGQSRDFDSKKDALKFMEEHNILPVAVELTSRAESEPESHALYNARSMIGKIEDSLDTGDSILYLSGPTNFRNGIATIKPYKGNRDKAHKPIHGPAIKAMLRREYDVITSVDQEADDDMATAHYAMWLRDPFSSVIATIDKDLDMIPGLHHNFATQENYVIEPEEGIRNFYEQLLKGDPTDNIPGLPGIGKVKARAALADCKTEEDMYWKAMLMYREAYPEEYMEALLENGRLLWIRRDHNDWWNPPEVVRTT